MSNYSTIGEMINDEVRRQQISIVDFAKMIKCERANVYNIFKRNNIDIELLKRISTVLNHNYFEDLAKNIDLAQPVEISDQEIKRLQALDVFLTAVPKAFERLGLDVAITAAGTKNGIEKEIPLPDYFLSDFNITFCVGQTYKEKSNGFWGNKIMFTDINYSGPAKMVSFTKMDDGLQSLNIAIDYMTEEEWFETIRFAMDEIKGLYLPLTWSYINKLRYEKDRLQARL